MDTRKAAACLLVPALVACSGSDADPADVPTGSARAAGTSLEQRATELASDAQVYDGIVSGISVALTDEEGHREVTVGKDITGHAATFMIASVSKPMVATVILRLVDDGKVALDDTVDDLLPGLLDHGSEVSVEQLLSMASGLPDYSQEPGYKGPGTTSAAALVDLVAHEPLRFEPGSRAVYNNTNFAVLQLVAERVGARPLGDLLERWVFRPAGMTNSSFGGTPDVPGLGPDGDPIDSTQRFPSGGAGVVASAPDVAAFLDALIGGRLLSDDVLQDMLAEHSTVVDGGYGLGIARQETPCGTAYGHEGGNDGYEASAWTVPDIHRTTAALVNSGDVGAATSLALGSICD